MKFRPKLVFEVHGQRRLVKLCKDLRSNGYIVAIVRSGDTTYLYAKPLNNLTNVIKDDKQEKASFT